MMDQDPKESSREKLNPFYKPPVQNIGRREFIGLIGGVAGWTFASLSGDAAAHAADAKPGTVAPEAPGRKGGGKGGGGGRGDDVRFVVPNSLAEFAELSVVLGRVTDKSVTVSILSRSEKQIILEVGTAAEKYSRKTPVATCSAGQPLEIVIDQLSPNTTYFYRLQHRPTAADRFTARPERQFTTQRASGSSFTFTIQGDSHPERMGKVTDPELYARTLLAAAADKPDFHICIGDDFSVEHVRTVSKQSLAMPYLLQRPFLGLIGQTAPVFLMNGNHEQASLYNYSQTDVRREVAVGVQVARNTFYPTPSAGGFYSGDPTPWKDIGELKSYCAWTWGDALFVLLDNYWHSPALVDTGFQGEDANPKQGGGRKAGGKGGKEQNRDWWGITLGDAQYQWFKKTLETSKARYKFVFAHHVHGSGRGGVDQADLYEWGGKDRRGASEFATKRRGWEQPIHQLMVKHKVNIFFQGHDHLYCRQEKDGVVYQEVPMPSDFTYAAANADRYAGNTKLANSGYLRVTVSPRDVKVEYVRTWLAKDETVVRKTGSVDDSYVVIASAS